MKHIIHNKKIIIIIFIIIIIIGCLIYFLLNNDNKYEEDNIIGLKEIETTTLKESHNFIDIKGSVANPGVYEFKENDRVIDAIELAGGLTKDANTSNINLSQKLKSEMVIYVYNNKEIKENTISLSCDNICKPEIIEVNNCIEVTTTKNSSSGLININKASLDDLMTISGIGESKAKSIIEYRNNVGKFNSIEDIKNISGIGESLFDKIKDKITV